MLNAIRNLKKDIRVDSLGQVTIQEKSVTPSDIVLSDGKILIGDSDGKAREISLPSGTTVGGGYFST